MKSCVLTKILHFCYNPIFAFMVKCHIFAALKYLKIFGLKIEREGNVYIRNSKADWLLCPFACGCYSQSHWSLVVFWHDTVGVLIILIPTSGRLSCTLLLMQFSPFKQCTWTYLKYYHYYRPLRFHCWTKVFLNSNGTLIMLLLPCPTNKPFFILSKKLFFFLSLPIAFVIPLATF